MTSYFPGQALLRHNSRASNASGNSGSSTGFRLNDEIDTSSVYSIYKQKIDRMFNIDNIEQNNVQVRIEKMFNDVAYQEGIKEENRHVFSVDYLGSVPLQEKVTNLHGLQDPLKKLYFTYKRTMKKKLTEISCTGLKVIYQGDNGVLEQQNPYPTIAVWSAVKFVIKDKKFAFLPLITDPDTCEKQNLFQSLDENNKYITQENHQPLFTVVMRKIGLGKTLEMHSFVCQTSEDAIVIAATLYKSLMTFMKHKTVKPKTKNGLGCLSISSSTYADSIIPIRPPRKKKSTSSSHASITSKNSTTNVRKSTKTKQAPTVPQENEKNPKDLTYKENTQSQNDVDEIRPYEEPIDDLKRCRILRKENINKNNVAQGDILTKVTIPGSGSFLNARGLTRYKSKVNRTNGLASGGSPLGFSELFTEFRLQENLHSLDEILAAIVNPNGMSFNDLKPIYKEFLLKLAVTLTKDELYQRAKAIIRRKKRRDRKKQTITLGVKKIKRTLILASCKWLREHSLLALSKLPSLENLSLYQCTNLSDSVAYMSITAKFGFRRLLRIDIRQTGIGDQFLKCFHSIRTLREIYLEAPKARGRKRKSVKIALFELQRLCAETSTPRAVVFSARPKIGLKSPKKHKKPSTTQPQTRNSTFNCMQTCQTCSLDNCSVIPTQTNDSKSPSPQAPAPSASQSPHATFEIRANGQEIECSNLNSLHLLPNSQICGIRLFSACANSQSVEDATQSEDQSGFQGQANGHSSQVEERTEDTSAGTAENAGETTRNQAELLYCDDVSDSEDEDSPADDIEPGTAALLDHEALQADVTDAGVQWFLSARPDTDDPLGQPSVLFRPPYSSPAQKETQHQPRPGPSREAPSPPPSVPLLYPARDLRVIIERLDPGVHILYEGEGDAGGTTRLRVLVASSFPSVLKLFKTV